MKKVVLMIAVAALIGFMSSGSVLADRMGERHARQAHRIHMGVHSGRLTRGEAHALIREQHHIRHMRYRTMVDGRLTPRERLRLEYRQHRAGAHIFRLKNNGRVRCPR